MYYRFSPAELAFLAEYAEHASTSLQGTEGTAGRAGCPHVLTGTSYNRSWVSHLNSYFIDPER